eukprot:Pgem_evm1s12643
MTTNTNDLNLVQGVAEKYNLPEPKTTKTTKKPVKRRRTDEVDRNQICQFPGCKRRYALRRALVAHCKVKHGLKLHEITFKNERDRRIKQIKEQGESTLKPLVRLDNSNNNIFINSSYSSDGSGIRNNDNEEFVNNRSNTLDLLHNNKRN